MITGETRACEGLCRIKRDSDLIGKVVARCDVLVLSVLHSLLQLPFEESVRSKLASQLTRRLIDIEVGEGLVIL